MTDVLPVVLVGADEDLAVELIGGHGERRHIRRKLKKRGKAVHTDETQTDGERCGKSVFVLAGEDETPFAERGNIDVVGIGFEPGLFSVSAMHQKESRANMGEVLCTTSKPCALR